MIRAVIADDDELQRAKLRQALQDIDDVHIIAECATANETIGVASNADLLFLEVRIPQMNGFEVAKALSSKSLSKRPEVIFVTANEQYALQAFETHATDYLLKPFSVERLRLAVGRARGRKEVTATPKSMYTRHEYDRDAADRLARPLILKSRGRIVFLRMNEIARIDTEHNQLRISTPTESHLVPGPLGRLESRLDPTLFVRVNRSSIVDLSRIKEVESYSSGEASVILRNEEMMPLSRTYRARIQNLLQISLNAPGTTPSVYDSALRDHLVRFLTNSLENTTLEDALEGLRAELPGKVPDGLESSLRHIVEHWLLAQSNILGFLLSSICTSLKWLEGSWGKVSEPGGDNSWNKACLGLRAT